MNFNEQAPPVPIHLLKFYYIEVLNISKRKPIGKRKKIVENVE